jgi:hypothetical protein
MPKAKITSATVRKPTKVTPVWQIGIIFPNGNKIMKPKCTLNEIFLTYFLDLEKYLAKGYTAEQLLELYKKTYTNKGIKVGINYIDSWGHKWTGKVAWPRETKFIDFLNIKLNEIHKNN